MIILMSRSYQQTKLQYGHHYHHYQTRLQNGVTFGKQMLHTKICLVYSNYYRSNIKIKLTSRGIDSKTNFTVYRQCIVHSIYFKITL